MKFSLFFVMFTIVDAITEETVTEDGVQVYRAISQTQGDFSLLLQHFAYWETENSTPIQKNGKNIGIRGNMDDKTVIVAMDKADASDAYFETIRDLGSFKKAWRVYYRDGNK